MEIKAINIGYSPSLSADFPCIGFVHLLWHRTEKAKKDIPLLVYRPAT
jgi:hypothetical protein